MGCLVVGGLEHEENRMKPSGGGVDEEQRVDSWEGSTFRTVVPPNLDGGFCVEWIFVQSRQLEVPRPYQYTSVYYFVIFVNVGSTINIPGGIAIDQWEDSDGLSLSK